MDTSTPKVAIATLNAKAYYTLTSLLKEMNIPFESIPPGENVNLDVSLILTTRKEQKQIGTRKMLCLEDIIEDNTVAKERIFSMLYSTGKDILIVGIDPGERTGVVAYYREKEIHEAVTRSLEETLFTVSRLVRNSRASRKVIRVGDGNLNKARTIADNLLRSFKEKIEVEIVDEKGTSTTPNPLHIKESRDLRSARIISFRSGERYQGIW